MLYGHLLQILTDFCTFLNKINVIMGRNQTSAKPNSVDGMVTREQSPLMADEVEISPGTGLTSQEINKSTSRWFSLQGILAPSNRPLTNGFISEFLSERARKFQNEKDVHISRVPKESIILFGHVLYKIKTSDVGSRTYKAIKPLQQ